MSSLSKRRFVQLAGLSIANRILPQLLWAAPGEPKDASSRKVIIDSKGSNGNMLYLPLDKLVERSRESSGAVNVQPPITVEAEPTGTSDSRARVER